MEIRVHQPGQLDFQIVTKDVSVTEFRRKPSAVWAYLETPGHVIFFTRRGKRDCAPYVSPTRRDVSRVLR